VRREHLIAVVHNLANLNISQLSGRAQGATLFGRRTVQQTPRLSVAATWWSFTKGPNLGIHET
jgi:hypothetical protein